MCKVGDLPMLMFGAIDTNDANWLSCFFLLKHVKDPRTCLVSMFSYHCPKGHAGTMTSRIVVSGNQLGIAASLGCDCAHLVFVLFDHVKELRTCLLRAFSKNGGRSHVGTITSKMVE